MYCLENKLRQDLIHTCTFAHFYQMHNLLELIQKEQAIYSICFHELIGQVSVQCVERGELLANIRKRYSNLLDRIPRQVKRYVCVCVCICMTLWFLREREKYERP